MDYKNNAAACAGYSADQNGLIFMRNAIKNFGIYMRRAQCTGWSDKPGANVCNWPGITCIDKQVVGLHFLNNGSVLVGERLSNKDPFAACFQS